MELRHLRYFVAVADTGNLTQAAERCFVAQSALSAQIARLEAEFGSELFVRSRRGMRLTTAGEALLPRARRLLTEADRVEQDMAALRGMLAGRLRIGMIQGSPPSLEVVGLVAAFHEQHPGVRLFIRTGASHDLAHDVVDGDLDVAVVALRDSDLPAALTATPLIDDPLVAVIPQTAALRSGVPVSVGQLVELGPFIHYRRGSGLRRAVTEAFDRAEVDVEASFELDQISDMARLVALGAGVAVVPSSAVSAAPERARVVALSDRAALHTITAISSAGASAATTAFLGLLRQAAASPR
ncbi:hypothetical protein GCM10011609_76450 [Lentzea pudingi]|uniref:HTH lysR-type domain-containing protein n=1 Tax=Lentzea pudingi TaxID=1789439 RepID=A0ABQ2ISL0_9PSEU|nr:LysR family transcriptional regulator [Lentzea pudingi]GGN23587.1 hypothetical protein GCM10011609_76450 [Lentzea pudingi]